MKLRIVTEAYAELKKEDPNTSLTLTGLRRLVRSGEIPTIKVGRKSLIDYDKLVQYLSGDWTVEKEDTDPEVGVIRKADKS